MAEMLAIGLAFVKIPQTQSHIFTNLHIRGGIRLYREEEIGIGFDRPNAVDSTPVIYHLASTSQTQPQFLLQGSFEKVINLDFPTLTADCEIYFGRFASFINNEPVT